MRHTITIALMTLAIAGMSVAGPVRINHPEAQAAHAVALAKANDSDARVKWADVRDEIQSAQSNMDAVVTAGIADPVAKAAVVALKKATKDLAQAVNKVVKKEKAEDDIAQANQ